MSIQGGIVLDSDNIIGTDHGIIIRTTTIGAADRTHYGLMKELI